MPGYLSYLNNYNFKYLTKFDRFTEFSDRFQLAPLVAHSNPHPPHPTSPARTQLHLLESIDSRTTIAARTRTARPTRSRVSEPSRPFRYRPFFQPILVGKKQQVFQPILVGHTLESQLSNQFWLYQDGRRAEYVHGPCRLLS